MAVKKETVLYYQPENSDGARLLKSVLVRMGIRIKNIAPSQVQESVGFLAGLPGFEKREKPENDAAEEIPVIPEEVLVLQGFGSRRLDELLRQLRRAKAAPGVLKAVLTESNCRWSFYELYQEIRAEREKLQAADSEEK